MTEPNVDPCDSCGNAIINRPGPGREEYSFNVYTGNNAEYNHHTFDLCNDCVARIVTLIQGKDDTPTKVDPADFDRVIESLQRQVDYGEDLIEQLHDFQDVTDS